MDCGVSKKISKTTESFLYDGLQYLHKVANVKLQVSLKQFTTIIYKYNSHKVLKALVVLVQVYHQ